MSDWHDAPQSRRDGPLPTPPGEEEPPAPRGNVPGSFWTALVCAALAIAAFAWATAGTVMPPAERWAALTVFSLLVLATTVQGSAEFFDALGQVVRRDLRALTTLLALLPVLYAAYSTLVREFRWEGLLVALAFAILPGLAFAHGHGQRTPTLLDAVAALYLLLSLEFGLVPALELPQQGGLVSFFRLSTVPLLLLLLAARGWPGLGFTWFMRGPDLRAALLGASALLLPLGLALATGLVERGGAVPAPLDTLALAANTYFLTALPTELLLRGLVQNGLQKWLVGLLRRNAGTLRVLWLAGPTAVGVAALIGGATTLQMPATALPGFWLAALAHLSFGLVYQHTGKVTVSAVTHMLVVWGWLVFAG